MCSTYYKVPTAGNRQAVIKPSAVVLVHWHRTLQYETIMTSLIEVFMTEKRTDSQYPREFKEEAVALITDQGYFVQKAADSLGIRGNLLYRWQRQLGDQRSVNPLSEDEVWAGLATSRIYAPMKVGCISLLSWIYILAGLSVGISTNA